MQRWLRVIQVAQKLPATRETIRSNMASKAAWVRQRHLAATPRSFSAAGRPPYPRVKVRRAPGAGRALNLLTTCWVFYNKCRPKHFVVNNNSSTSFNNNNSGYNSSFYSSRSSFRNNRGSINSSRNISRNY